MRTAASDALWGQAEPSPVPQVGELPTPAAGQSVLSPEYFDSMKSGYDSGSCSLIASPCGGSACCHNHYIYANALLMTHNKMGGFVTAVDSLSGSPRVIFCNSEFGNMWSGGFEVGTGWCFGCNCNTALELVYWGIFPSTFSSQATGNINSTIDFGDLTYGGQPANNFYQNAGFQRVAYSFNFNSFEANIVGNSMCGGPFGCNMCGCCMGRSGSPWGFGYTAGFRYINLSESWLYSTNPTGFGLVGNPQELNYAVGLNNNLFGFQVGTGLSYCLTNRLTAYVIGKVGIYDNHVTQLQQVYGTLGNAVIANGPNVGQDFLVRSSREELAMAAQFDLGGRWNINNNWSMNFGYRVLGLSGVDIAEDNVQHNQFHNVDGIAFIQRQGSFILHGMFLGATYCW